MAGIFYGWIGIYYGELAKMVDTWAFHYEGLKEYELLLSHPHQFFTSLFENNYESGYGEFLSSENSWWNDLHGNLFIKILALFNLASFGNYYINVIFYSFLSFFGPMAVYRVMCHAFSQSKVPVLIATFLIPSFIYWSSGLHKDGLIFVGLAIIIYQFYFGFLEKRFPLYRVLFILFGFLMILGLRNYLIINLIPAIGAWLLAQKVFKTREPILVFGVCYLFFILLFFTAGFINPKLNFPLSVVEKQQAFSKLEGSSAVATTALEPTVGSFLHNAPQAISLSIIRPYPTDVKHLLSLAAAVEIDAILAVFILLLFFRKRINASSPFLWFSIFFSFSVLITIGYTVNFLGAIVRYRSIVFPLLLTPVVAFIDWPLIGRFFFDINNKNNI